MIEHSQDSVRPDTRDTTLLLLFLLIFALSASGYVCLKGWEDGERSKYELLLHCILIITSVIPPELPMQMALAVNSSLMTLMKMQVCSSACCGNRQRNLIIFDVSGILHRAIPNSHGWQA